MACTPKSVAFGLLAPDNKRQISFSFTKGCLADDKPLYVIHFVLRDKVGDDFQDRVKLFVTVGDIFDPKAEKVLNHGLTMSQLQFLSGPVTNRAKALPAGTTADKKTEDLLAALPKA
jgi:hypothetical protein